MRPFVLTGNPTQFVNFCHVFGEEFTRLESVEQLQSIGSRPLVLLVGTWAMNPLHEPVLDWLRKTDKDRRPNGQAFAMLGRPGR